MTNKEKSDLQKEVVDSIGIPNGRLLLAPRIGKTRIGINIIKREKPKSILWVTPFAKLATEDIPYEFITWKAKPYLSKLKTVTWSSLSTIKGKYDLIFLDEEQYITENNAINLLNGELSGNIITLTGTATKDSSKLDLLNKLKLPVLYDISINEAVDLGLLSNYTINVLKIPYDRKNKYINWLEHSLKPLGNFTVENNIATFTGNISGTLRVEPFISKKGEPLLFLKDTLGTNHGYLKPDLSYGKVTFKGEEYSLKEGIVSKSISKLALYNAIKTYEQKTNIAKELLEKLKGKSLLFCSSIEQAEKICKNTYHSKSKNTDLIAFKEGKIEKISMVNTGGVGFTYNSIDNLIITQCDSDRNGNTSQKICRTLLKQKDYKANIWIICLKGTTDENWVNSVLESFDPSKIIVH